MTNQTNTVKDADKDFEWSFSDKHTRLRFQLIISVLLVAAVSYLEISSMTLPGVGLELSVPPTGWMILLSSCFYVFTLVSFVLRTYNEHKARSPENIFFLESYAEVNNKIEKVMPHLDFMGGEGLKKSIKQMDDLLENFERLQTHWPTVRRDIAAHLNLPSMMMKFPKWEEKRRIANYKASMAQFESSLKADGDERFYPDSVSDMQDISLNLEIEEDNFKRKQSELLGQIPDISLLALKEGELKSIVSDASETYLSQAKEINQAVTKLNRLKDTLSNLTSDKNDFVRRGDKVKRTFSIERNLLGAFFPIGISVIIFLICLPPMYKKVSDFTSFQVMIQNDQ